MKRKLLLLAALAIPPIALYAAPVIVQGPKIITTGDDLIAAGTDGVETSGDIDIDSTALVAFSTDSDSQIVLKPGFQASPGTGGKFEAYIETDAAALADLINMMDLDMDGMTDVWEQFYGFNQNANDASADLDGDGISNLSEINSGTNAMADNAWFPAPGAPTSGSYGVNPILIVDSAGSFHNVSTTDLTLSAN